MCVARWLGWVGDSKEKERIGWNAGDDLDEEGKISSERHDIEIALLIFTAQSTRSIQDTEKR